MKKLVLAMITFLLLFLFLAKKTNFFRSTILVKESDKAIYIKTESGKYLADYFKDYKIEVLSTALQEIDASIEGLYFVCFTKDEQRICKNVFIDDDIESVKRSVDSNELWLYSLEYLENKKNHPTVLENREQIEYYCDEKPLWKDDLPRVYGDYIEDIVFSDDSGTSIKMVDDFVDFASKQEPAKFKLVEKNDNKLGFGNVIEYEYNEEFQGVHYAIYLGKGLALHGNFAKNKPNKAVVCPVDVKGFKVNRYLILQKQRFVYNDDYYIDDIIYFPEDYSEETCIITIPQAYLQEYQELIEWCENNSYDDLMTYE